MVSESVSIEQIMEYYRLMNLLTHKGDKLIGPCPIHKGRNKSQFYISLGKNVFHCFGGCKGDASLHNGGGNLIDFVRFMEGIEDADDADQYKAALRAALLTRVWFGLTSQRTPRMQPHSESVWEQNLYKTMPWVICVAKLRTDLLDNRSLAILLETYKLLIC